MALVEMNWTPTRRELRQFAAITLVACAIIGGVLRWTDHPTVSTVIWAAGAAVGLVGLVAPSAVRPVFLLLSVVSWPIGVVVSYVVLAVFYYVIITGTGLAFRLAGRDPLHRKFDPEAESYWQPKVLPGVEDKERYFRQF